jgi:alkanesulfonate monooxygenase SsuD/methylene tetrahydromethanopterin reductase-like flavin-dependent oxidoreductase (luciferase family)
MDFMAVSLSHLSERGKGMERAASQAENLGYTHFGIGEGPLLLSDCYQCLALASQVTTRIQLGTCVTNPLTRLPPQSANSIASLNALAPGRTFFGIGAANNAMRSMGFRVARTAEMEDALRVIKGLLAGERVLYTWEGTQRYIELLDRSGSSFNIADPIPIFVSAGGPKAIEVAGRYADAMIYSLGPNADMIRLVRGLLDQATEAAGRPAGSVKLFALTHFHRLHKGEGLNEAIAQGFGAAPLVACVDNRQVIATHADVLGEQLAHDVNEAIAVSHVAKKVDPMTDHLKMFEDFTRGLDPVRRAAITERIARSFTLYGDADECLEQTRLMADAGVDGIALALLNPMNYEHDASDFAEAVIQRW